MADSKTMEQTELVIDGIAVLLAQGQDVGEIMHQIEEAVATTGRFVRFTEVGNREVSVLVTPTSRASVRTAAALFDVRDDGDTNTPFGGFFDYTL